ncbi:MAG: ATP-binding protein, partial [Candidatus Mariimomonas ferrooxydans]
EFIKFTRFPEPVFIDNNMNTVIEEVTDLISQNMVNLGITVNLSLQEDLPLFNFDTRQFKIVFMNLAQNAIKAMPKGGILEIKAETRNSKILIIVSDTGAGIPDKNINKILIPFFSTSEGGLGLGLSIVHKIIENHHGSISCTSKVGEGTVFEIVLPIERV